MYDCPRAEIKSSKHEVPNLLIFVDEHQSVRHVVVTQMNHLRKASVLDIKCKTHIAVQGMTKAADTS